MELNSIGGLKNHIKKIRIQRKKLKNKLDSNFMIKKRILPSIIKEKSKENTSLYRALKKYTLGNKYTIAMVEEVIDFY